MRKVRHARYRLTAIILARNMYLDKLTIIIFDTLICFHWDTIVNNMLYFGNLSPVVTIYHLSLKFNMLRSDKWCDFPLDCMCTHSLKYQNIDWIIFVKYLESMIYSRSRKVTCMLVSFGGCESVIF